MKRFLPGCIALVVFGAFVATLVFLWAKSREPAQVFETDVPFRTDIVKKTVATGAVVPRNEVSIKSRVSGVVDVLFVEPGDEVASGDLIARIRIIPDSVTLNNARSAVDSSRIGLDEAAAELKRGQSLYAQHALSRAELDRLEVDHRMRQSEFNAALVNLQLVREGAAGGGSHVSTEVRSTVSGMVLALGVKKGESVIESNNFNEGTTIADVADMSDMIFQGNVDESEVGKIREGMALDIAIGAALDDSFGGNLEYIAPKGQLLDGAVQFEIRAALEAVDGVFVRAGSSATADIVLDRRDDVLAVKESVLRFDDGVPYVDVERGEQQFEPRKIEVGLSDGIQIEVLSGLTADERVKKQEG